MTKKNILHDGSPELLVWDFDFFLGCHEGTEEIRTGLREEYEEMWRQPFRLGFTPEHLLFLRHLSGLMSAWGKYSPQTSPMRFAATRLDQIVSELILLKEHLETFDQSIEALDTVAFYSGGVYVPQPQIESLPSKLARVRIEHQKIAEQRIANLGIQFGKAVFELLRSFSSYRS